jgi:hypothetical protein
VKAVVTISRYWKNPKISTVVTDDSISLTISLDDFIAALKSEIGSVTSTFTQKTFESKVDAAVSAVLEKVKEESIKVV